MFRTLPDIIVDRKLVALACAEQDLVELAVLTGSVRKNVLPFELSEDDPDSATLSLCRLFGRSPLLLIFALSEFRSFGSRPPNDASELATWFLEHAARRMTQRSNRWQSADAIELATASRKYRRGLADYQTATGNRSLRKALKRVLKSVIDIRGLKAADWIDVVAGKNLTATSIHGRDEKRSSAANGIDFSANGIDYSANPIDYSANPIDYSELFRLVSVATENEEEFEQRLLEEKLLAMKQLAYGASHEINNPLANIATRAQAMLKVEDHAERRRKLAVIYHQAMKAHEMISDLMLFAHPPAARPEVCDLHEIVSSVAAEMTTTVRAAGARLNINLYPDVEQVHIDRTQIAAALAALIRNAVEAIESCPVDASGRALSENDCNRDRDKDRDNIRMQDPDERDPDKRYNNQRETIPVAVPGRIDISIWRNDDRTVAVSVTDNGPGPSEAARRHMFDPFYSGREAGRGLGFGLSKAWRICRINNGQLRYDAAWTGGTRFVISLPVAGALPGELDKVVAA